DHYQGGRARVLVPILDNQYGVVLEAGRFAVRFDAAGGTFAVHYADLRFPLSPATYAELLAGAADEPGCLEEARVELRRLADGFAALPRGNGDPVPRGARDELKRALAGAAGAREALHRAGTGHLAFVNGQARNPRR